MERTHQRAGINQEHAGRQGVTCNVKKMKGKRAARSTEEVKKYPRHLMDKYGLNKELRTALRLKFKISKF